MTFEDATKEVADMLATNRNGAYALAVRLQAIHGHNADKLMSAAAVADGSPVAVALAIHHQRSPLVPLPTAEELETKLLEDIQQHYSTPIGQNTYTLAHCFVQLMVEDRNRILQLLGVGQ